MPNITTNHAITYTNYFRDSFDYLYSEIHGIVRNLGSLLHRTIGNIRSIILPSQLKVGYIPNIFLLDRRADAETG